MGKPNVTPEAVGSPADRAVQGIAEAHWRFLQAVHQAWCPEELQGIAQKAQESFREASNNPEKQVEAYRGYAQSLQEIWAPERVSSRLRAAYEDFLRASAQTWSSIDPSTLTPWHLAAIARVTYAAAWVGACTGAWRPSR